MFSSVSKYVLTLCFLALGSCYLLKPKVHYFVKNSDQWSVHLKNEQYISFGDSLFLSQTSDGTPKSFYQHYSTGVCFDNQCRPLDIILHWSISGRYLGFEMPKGEFLSKTDHDPFTRKEYLQLNEILSNADLPFKDIKYHELMNQPESSIESVDAISGATSERIKDIVVKNAAYTTYKLWKLVYGESQKFIEQYTEKHLNNSNLLTVLNSQDRDDIFWGLTRMKDTLSFSIPIKNRLLSLIQSDDYYLSYNAVHAIPKTYLNDSDFLENLFLSYLNTSDASTKNVIFSKLKAAPRLSQNLVVKSRQTIPTMTPQEISSVLKLYEKHSINDHETCKVLVGVLENKNIYISKKAYDFLIKIQTDDEFIAERLKAYKNQ
ncbi:MAG: hypothetical protein VX994_01090 [Bacteroidota bacterium]|nr:hypothetical protein [Bacteroidota bacterium]